MFRKYPFLGYAISIIGLAAYTGLLFFLLNAPLSDSSFSPLFSSSRGQSQPSSDSYKPIWSSVDGGKTWKPLAASGNLENYYQSLVCPSTLNCYGVSDSDYVLTTSDGGQSWTEKPTGLNFTLVNISCGDALNCLALGEDEQGVAAIDTTDGGKTWKLASKNIAPWEISGLACPSAQLCLGVGEKGQILATTDLGQTWSRQDSGSESHLAGISCVSNSNCTIVGTSGTILTTADGGQHWNKGQTSFTGTLSEIDCPSAQTCFILGYNNNNTKIITTGDSGQTWTTLSSTLSGENMAFTCTSASTCLVASDSGGIKTTGDGGKSWVKQDTGEAFGFYSISCPDKTTCYGITYSDIYDD
jgi:photosystem II stability/assembly factor-like uncharacterized protein